MRLFLNLKDRFQRKSVRIVIPPWQAGNGVSKSEPTDCLKRAEIETLFVRELRVGKAPKKTLKVLQGRAK